MFYDGKKVRRKNTPFVKALSLRAKAEEIQRKYPKKRKRYAIVLEELTDLIEELRSMNKQNRWKNFYLDYRTLQNAIITKAIEYNVPLYFIDPRGTSKLCYKCGSELVFQGRLGICPRCGFIADRDKNATMNIHKRMWGSLGSLPNAPAVKDETRRSRGRRDEGEVIEVAIRN